MSDRPSTRFAVLASFAALALAHPGCTADPAAVCAFAPGYSEHDVGGRRYGIFVPAVADGAGIDDVVLVFHGDAPCEAVADDGSCAASPPVLGDVLRSQFDLEGRVDAAIVYVEGANQNRFRPDVLSWDTFSADDNADFAFVDAVLDDLFVNEGCAVDDVAAVGFSGGAFFANSYACLHGDSGTPLTAVVSFEGGFEDGDVATSYDEANVVDVAACADLPPAFLVNAADDTVVPPRYGDAALAVYGCDDVEDAGDDCVAACGSVLCSPPTADAQANPPRTHAIWNPEGIERAAAFLNETVVDVLK